MIVLVFGAVAGAEAASRRALLVGINDYTASGLGRRATSPDRGWADLQGAVNDVRSLREMLIQLYGFEERDILVLTDQQAKRDAILQSIEKHLVKPAAKGDVLLFYFAGHGSQVRNSLSEEPDRMDESIIPADSRFGARDIRDKELHSLFNAILDQGAQLTVILDNCHSGSGARGLPTGARPRGIKADVRDVADRRRIARPGTRGALVLTATQDFDQAWETRDEEGTFRGTFSWALLHAMRDSSAGESAIETFLRAQARMRAATPFQQPVIEAAEPERQRPLLTSRGDRRGERNVVFVEKVRDDGTVVVQGGWANGLAPGTELRVMSERDITARLQVTAMIGLGRSEARIEPGRSRPLAVKQGAMLEVVGWAAQGGRPLRVWTPQISGNAQSIAALARRLMAEASRRGVRWISDPLEVTPAHVLRRRNNEWELVGSATGQVEHHGADPADAIAAVAKLPSASSLFVQLPAPAAMVDGIAIGPGTDREGIDPTTDPTQADYVLLGRYAGRRLEYAWVRPAVTNADKRKSGLPLRTDWIAEDGIDQTLRDSVAALRGAVLRLRRIHAWHLLESPSDERSPYRLELRRARNGEIAKDALIGDEKYELVLRATAVSRVRQRYVYVFVIDSHGKSFLLFPRSGSVENRLPLSLPAPREIRLGHDGSFEIAPPYGVDTYFFLTTDEPLPNPWILEWEGARTRTPESPTPLEQLFLLTGSTRRAGLLVTTPAWSLEKTAYESVPARAISKNRK